MCEIYLHIRPIEYFACLIFVIGTVVAAEIFMRQKFPNLRYCNTAFILH